jgi:anaerobic magnesium-protoporphyrin IX monomethyl ester cyclase
MSRSLVLVSFTLNQSDMDAHVLLLRPAPRRKQGSIFAMEQLGLSYLAATIRRAGYSVEIIDGFLEPQRYFARLDSMKADDYMLIGYPIYHDNVKRVAQDCQLLRDRGITTHITVGNYLATLASDEVLADYPQFDSAIRGEGEYTCLELLQALDHAARLDSVLGLSFRDRETIVSNPPRPNELNLDSFPFPARDTLPFVIKAGNAPLIYSSRGCNARCDFCSVHKFYNSSPNGAWRARTAENVVDEMDQLNREFGVTEFAFADEQFMGHGPTGAKRAISLAEELLQRGRKYKWYIETRSSEVKRDVFEILASAGLTAVYMGLESGYEPALREMKKGLHVQQHLQAVELLNELGIMLSVGFIMFRPSSSFEEIRHNLQFYEMIGSGEIVHLASCTKVYVGTTLQIKMSGQKLLGGDFKQFQWEFDDYRVRACFHVMKEAGVVLSAAYNEFAAIRKSGLLTFSEAANFQRYMNQLFIDVMKAVLDAVELCGGELPESSKRNFELLFQERLLDFLHVARFIRLAAESRSIENGVRLLNPMALC